VGGVPILETLLRRLADQGFQQIYLSVNYKADMIEDYFGTGDAWGVQIEYLREEERRGTAGALSLFPRSTDRPLLVLNGDLLTTLDFGRMIDFHEQEGGRATMGVREHQVDIPYGVIDTDGPEIEDIQEKPTHRHFLNAGIYVLEADTLGLVPDGQRYDMTELFQGLLERGDEVAAYPLQAYWRDIGEVEDLKKAEDEFDQVFR
jgi:NDP-sugar pyrophosphorylase family protein